MAVSTAVLGGETKSRGTFSGRGSRGVLIAWVVLGVVGVVLVLMFELWGMGVTLLAGVVVWVLTRSTGGEHTVMRNIQDRRRWRFIRRHGFDDFTPVGWRPAGLTATPRRRVGPLLLPDRVPRRHRRAYNAFRDWPDGVDGMHFLQHRGGRTAVAYHLPPGGEQPYFSVVFAVDGPIVGLAGDTMLERAQEAFGELMAGWGSRQKLVTGIQLVTRILPADTAGHEAWLSDQLDPDAPEDLVTDYSELLSRLTSSSFVQRHYVVIRWDKTPRLAAVAAAHAPGRAGWLALIGEQSEMARQRLTGALFRNVRALSGPQLAAVIRHLQHPGWPIDQASDVTTDSMYLPSHSTRRHVETIAAVPDPLHPDRLLGTSSWLHATAQIPVRDMETMPRNGLWLTPLLTGMTDQVVRTLSVHIGFTAAQDAKRQAKLDATGDRADLVGQQRKGKIIDDDTELALTSAETRLADVRTGTGHHGARWAGFLTISVADADAMPVAVAQIEEAADACGINRLDWLPTQQAAAQCLTWPVGRALSPPRAPASSQALDWITSASAGKER